MFIWVFTRRPWPNRATFPVGREDLYLRAWETAPDVGQITAAWLARHAIPYDKLTIERGTEGEETRFSAAREGKIQAFVEDNSGSATALAPDCERVFLVDQPYNRAPQVALPPNVVRVYGWNDIEFAALLGALGDR
jgi:uncharacterized HAD superfamily protein